MPIKKIVLLLTIFTIGCSSTEIKTKKQYNMKTVFLKKHICYEISSEKKCNGVLYKYYKSGQISIETHYINGLVNGFDKFYYPSGKLEYVGLYKNNRFIRSIYGEKSKIVSSYTIKPGVTYEILQPSLRRQLFGK